MEKFKAKVLIARPAGLGLELVEQLQQLGVNTVLCPVMECQPTISGIDFQKLFISPNNYSIVIFVSQHAVKFTVLELLKANLKLPIFSAVAIGPSTGKLLLKLGLQEVCWPANSSYNSESVLKIPVFSNVKGKKILLVRGNGGRSYLITKLLQKGANLKVLEAYKKLRINEMPATAKDMCIAGGINFIVATSYEILANLVVMFSEFIIKLQKSILVVPSERIGEFARCLGFEKILVSTTPENREIVKTIANIL